MRSRSRRPNRSPLPVALLAGLLAAASAQAAPAFELSEYDRYLTGRGVMTEPAPILETEADRGSPPAGGEGRPSDEAFLDELVDADPALEGAEDASFSPRAGRTESVRWFSEYHASNQKPGYLLLGDSEGEPDYESSGYVTGVEASAGRSVSVKATRASRSALESGTGEVTIAKTGVAVTLRVPGTGAFTARADSIDTGRAEGATQFGLGGSGKAGPVRVALDLDRKVYAADAASAAKPAEYDRAALRAGYASGDLFLQVTPAFERYAADGNSKRELAAMLSFEPSAAPGWTFDLHGEASAFAKERGEGGDFVYFSPSSRENLGAGIGHRSDWGEALTCGLALALDRERYTRNGEETSYFVASWQAGAQWRVRRGVALSLDYDGSLSQTDGFPFSQAFRGGVEMKF